MTLARTLSAYRGYHRDHRNLATHAVGIPLIVLSIEVLLARPVWEWSGMGITPSIVLSGLAAIYYLRLDAMLGLVMTALLALLAALGFTIAQHSDAAWLGGGIALFVSGWILQLVGHHYERRKPAFLDDIKSLLIGPLFVVAEGVFALGMRRDLAREVHAATPD